MKFWEIILILAIMYPLAVAGAQFLTRRLKSKRQYQPKKIWKFELPTKEELLYALVAVIGLGLLMYKRGLFE